MATSNLVLRTVYISPDVDDKLRERAYRGSTSKNDLIRRYIDLGMKAERDAAGIVRSRSASSTAPAGRNAQHPNTVVAKSATSVVRALLAEKKAPAKKAPAKKVAAGKAAAKKAAKHA